MVDEAEVIVPRAGRSDDSRRAFGAFANRDGGAAHGFWYEASDSEREQPGWHVPKSTSLAGRHTREEEQAAELGNGNAEMDTDTDTDTSAKDTDDDSLLENGAIAARRARR